MNFSIRFLHSYLCGECGLLLLSFSSRLCIPDDLIAVIIHAKQKSVILKRLSLM